MKNAFLLLIIALICAISMYVGSTKISVIEKIKKNDLPTNPIPEIGKIQLLNGCGAEGAATSVADFLRENNFDVKFVGNADTWNYPYTMVIARSKDTSVASQVAHALKTDKFTMIRTNDNSYDVTVVIGPDYGERIQ